MNIVGSNAENRVQEDTNLVHSKILDQVNSVEICEELHLPTPQSWNISSVPAHITSERLADLATLFHNTPDRKWCPPASVYKG